MNREKPSCSAGENLSYTYIYPVSFPRPLLPPRRPPPFHKFKKILQRENLKSDLDDKFNTIFKNYGIELEQVQQLYERHSKVCVTRFREEKGGGVNIYANTYSYANNIYISYIHI